MQRETRKTKAEEGRRRQTEERRRNLGTWKKPPFWWGFFLANFNDITREIWGFLLPRSAHLLRSPPFLYSNTKKSGTCKRGRQKGVACFVLKTKRNTSEERNANRNKSVYSRKQETQIRTNQKKTGKSEQIEENRGDPLLVTPNWGRRKNGPKMPWNVTDNV